MTEVWSSKKYLWLCCAHHYVAVLVQEKSSYRKAFKVLATAALLDFHIWDLHHDHPWPMFTVLLLCVIRFVLFNICCAAASVSAFSVKMLVLPAFLDANFLTQLSSTGPRALHRQVVSFKLVNQDVSVSRPWICWFVRISWVRDTVVIFCDAAGSSQKSRHGRWVVETPSKDFPTKFIWRCTGFQFCFVFSP